MMSKIIFTCVKHKYTNTQIHKYTNTQIQDMKKCPKNPCDKCANLTFQRHIIMQLNSSELHVSDMMTFHTFLNTIDIYGIWNLLNMEYVIWNMELIELALQRTHRR